MKLTKLMLSASIAALALVSCNKIDADPEGPQGGMKSIEISIANSIFTKGDGGGAIPVDKSVTLNDLRIYLTDDNYSTFYTPLQADGLTPAVTYWSATTSQSITDVMVQDKISFHYVSPSVTKVIAVGNMGDTPYADIASLKAASLNVDDQQNQAALSLYGEGPVTGPSGTHTDGTVLNNIYKAEVTMKPLISRFEVAGFRVKFNDTPKYSTIEILQIAFDNYMPASEFYTGTESGTLVDVFEAADLEVSNSSEIYDLLAANTASGIWWYDKYASGAVSLTKAAPVKDVEQRAYHFFAGDVKPEFVIHLTADGVPAYIYTKKFWSNGATPQEITKFEEGTIYRMSAEGEVADSDGAIEIPEEKIDQMDRCLDISVTVEPWIVTLVTPEF